MPTQTNAFAVKVSHGSTSPSFGARVRWLLAELGGVCAMTGRLILAPFYVAIDAIKERFGR